MTDELAAPEERKSRFESLNQSEVSEFNRGHGSCCDPPYCCGPSSLVTGVQLLAGNREVEKNCSILPARDGLARLCRPVHAVTTVPSTRLSRRRAIVHRGLIGEVPV